MKILVLHSTSIPFCLENELKIFPSKEIHHKGGLVSYIKFFQVCSQLALKNESKE